MSSYGMVIDESGEETPIARSFDPSVLHSEVRHMHVGSRSAQGGLRRPYVYPSFGSRRSLSQTSLPSAAIEAPATPSEHREHNMAIRYRFFNRLNPGGSHLIMPAHVISSELFSILPFTEFKDQEGKQGSLVTIFSIWNTMMGTSLLAMPWAIQQAGFALGIFLILFMAFLAFYTAYRVVQSPTGLVLGADSSCAEFSDVCRYFYGKVGEFVAVFFSIVVLMGGVIVYFVLMSNFLYFTGNIVYESLQPNSTIIPVMTNKTFTCDIYCAEPNVTSLANAFVQDLSSTSQIGTFGFSRFTDFWRLQGSVPVILALMTFPLLNFKSPTFFTKFNVLGSISVMYLLIFTFSKAVECGINLDFVDPSSEHFAKLFDAKFPALTGTLALSYFIHNAILTILRNQKRPENNARDLSVGYVLSALCYLLIGTMFYIAFPVKRSCIADNFLNNFGTGDVLSATARVFLLFQMFTVLPLLMYLIRVQFSYVFAGTVYPGIFYVLLINLGVVTVATFFAVVYPHVGSILCLFGSFAGLVYVFALPCLIHMSRLKMESKLTRFQLFFHSAIIALGVLNLLAQIVIRVM